MDRPDTDESGPGTDESRSRTALSSGREATVGAAVRPAAGVQWEAWQRNEKRRRPGPLVPGMASAVEVAGLHKRYGAVAAVAGVSFTVEPGEIFALLGPNGAWQDHHGGDPRRFRARDSRPGGGARHRPRRPGVRAALRERIGLVLQDIAVEPYLTVQETIARNAGYYPAPRASPR